MLQFPHQVTLTSKTFRKLYSNARLYGTILPHTNDVIQLLVDNQRWFRLRETDLSLTINNFSAAATLANVNINAKQLSNLINKGTTPPTNTLETNKTQGIRILTYYQYCEVRQIIAALDAGALVNSTDVSKVLGVYPTTIFYCRQTFADNDTTFAINRISRNEIKGKTSFYL